MKRFHFRVYVGPTIVQAVAEKMRATAMPWQVVTIEGTEHVHYSICALHKDAATREAAQWFTRAGFGPTWAYDNSVLRTEEV